MIEPQVRINPTICVTATKLTAAAHDKNTCTVDTEEAPANPHSLELMVDTGPSVSVLPDTMYTHNSLTAHSKKLQTCSLKAEAAAKAEQSKTIQSLSALLKLAHLYEA